MVQEEDQDLDQVTDQDLKDQEVDQVEQVGQHRAVQAVPAVPVHKVDWVDLTNTSHLIIMVVMDTMDTTEITDSTDGWVIPGIGGADVVIGEAGTTVTLVGGGIPGTAILGGGGTEIIGGAGYPAGAPSLVRTDPTTIFLFFYERKIILMTFDTEMLSESSDRI